MVAGLLRGLFSLLLRLYFKEVRTVGLERVAARGPVLVVANHVNSLLDPLVLFVLLPRHPRFLAKAPLFHHPLVAPFLRALRALPVHRRSDGASTAANAATFEACEHALLDGECVALFPEGASHNEPHLLPLKTGAARIAGRAFQRGAPVRVVPVGLLFTARALFRSDVTAVAAPPVPLEDLAWGEGEAPEAVLAFTERLTAALRDVTANADRWEEYRLVESLRDLALEAAGREGDDLDPARLQRDLLERFREVRLERPLETAALLKAARPYARLLAATGLSDRDVAREFGVARALRRAAGNLAVLAAGWPPAIAGWLFHMVPYTLTALAARALSRTEDTASTYKIYGGLLFYPAAYALQLSLLGAALGPWAALAAALLAPPCGLWALHYYGHRESFARAAWAYLALRTQARLAGRLRVLRGEVLEALKPLAELYT